MDAERALARAVAPDPRVGPVYRHFGVVTAVAGGPPATVTVKISGSPTATAGIRYLSSYAPTINDVVILERVGGDFIAYGKLA